MLSEYSVCFSRDMSVCRLFERDVCILFGVQGSTRKS